jgi:hypothetical protein
VVWCSSSHVRNSSAPVKKIGSESNTPPKPTGGRRLHRATPGTARHLAGDYRFGRTGRALRGSYAWTATRAKPSHHAKTAS